MRWGLGISAIVLVCSLIYSVVQIVARRTDRRLLLMVVWISLPVLIGTLLRTGMRPENILIAFPIPFVLVALAIVQLAAGATPRTRYVPLVVILAISAMHIWYLSSLWRFVDDRQATTAGHYGLSYSQRRSIIQYVIEKAESAPTRIVGPYSGWYPAYEYVLMYEQNLQSTTEVQSLDRQILFWIDEQHPTANMSERDWRNQKERRINLSVSEYLLTAPNWVVEDHWYFEKSQIYLLRYKVKKPFQ
jgi:hypothetical protein